MGQFNVRWVVIIGIFRIEIGPRDVYDHDLSTIFRLGIPHMRDVAREIRGRQAEHRPQRLKRRRGRKDAVFSWAPDLPGHQPRPVLWLHVISLVCIHPFHRNGCLARSHQSLGPRASVPHALGFKVPELFCSGRTHQCWDERLSCHGVQITLNLLHRIKFARGFGVHPLTTLVLKHQVNLHITMYPVDAPGKLLVDYELRAESL